MVDSQSWVRHSSTRDFHFNVTERVQQSYQEYEYFDDLGEGCECSACEGIVDKPSQALPIRDFYWYGERDKDSVTLNDDFYLLCRPIVRGYALNERKWGMHDDDGFLFTRIFINTHS